MNLSVIRWVFVVAGLYDLIIGLVFLFLGPLLFDATGVPHPNHWAYIHFGALLLMVFGVMFLAVAASPHANRNLIPYGMMLKVSYCGIVGFYWLTEGVPWLFQPFFFIDVVMLVLFVMAYRALSGQGVGAVAGSAT